MGVQADITEALERDRADLIRVLADHRLRPAVVEGSGGSSLLGDAASPTFRLESASDDTGGLDRQTTTHVVDALGLDSEADCEAAREEIESHPAWVGD